MATKTVVTCDQCTDEIEEALLLGAWANADGSIHIVHGDGGDRSFAIVQVDLCGSACAGAWVEQRIARQSKWEGRAVTAAKELGAPSVWPR